MEDHGRSHKKFGPDRFSSFDVYWIQTTKQTEQHTYIVKTDRTAYIHCKNRSGFKKKNRGFLTLHKM